MPSIRIIVEHPVGLHARPAAEFVKTANQYQSDITLSNLTAASEVVNAKSILSVLTLGVNQGFEIEISANGPDETEALRDLEQLVQNNFGE